MIRVKLSEEALIILGFRKIGQRYIGSHDGIKFEIRLVSDSIRTEWEIKTTFPISCGEVVVKLYQIIYPNKVVGIASFDTAVLFAKDVMNSLRNMTFAMSDDLGVVVEGANFWRRIKAATTKWMLGDFFKDERAIVITQTRKSISEYSRTVVESRQCQGAVQYSVKATIADSVILSLKDIEHRFFEATKNSFKYMRDA